MKKIKYFLVALVAAGCSTPGVFKETKALSGAVDAAVAQIAPKVNKQVAAQKWHAKQHAIASRGQVYGDSIECSRIAIQPLSAKVSGCRLEPKYPFSKAKGTAVYQQLAISALHNYSKTLTSLVESKSPAEIKDNFNKFLGSLNGFAAAANAGAPKTIIYANQIAPLSGIAGRVVEAKRFSAVKRLVNDAHEPVRGILNLLLVEFDAREGFTSLNKERKATLDKMKVARETGSIDEYRRAVARWEAVIVKYETRLKKSDTGKLIAIWKAQQALHAQVNSGGDPKQLVSLLEDIKALTE